MTKCNWKLAGNFANGAERIIKSNVRNVVYSPGMITEIKN